MPETVDLYLRKSNKDQRRSVERQLADLTDAAEDEGLAIGRVFVDPDLSASRFAKKSRPDYAALLNHIHSGACRVVGIVESSRGSRGLTEWSSFLDLCRTKKVKVWVETHQRIYDLSRRRDWRALADEGIDAADESEKISERVLSGKRQAASKGRPAGRPTYGYLREYDASGRLMAVVSHPDEAPIVAEMITRVSQGHSLRAIADDLNTRGLATPTGRPWRGTFIRQSVLRPAYAGRRVHQGEDIGAAMWPPLVDPAVWRRAVAVLTRPERRSTTRGTALAHWLTGVALCGSCRATRLVLNSGGTKGKPRYYCEACAKVFISSSALESVVEAAILARLSQEDAAAVFAAPDARNAVQLQEAQDALQDLEDRLEQHYTEAATGALSARGLASVEKLLLPEIETAKEVIKKLIEPTILGDFEGRDIATEWPDLDPQQRRKVVRGLVEIVVLPAQRRGPIFDITRLDNCRWIGDELTWGQRRNITKG